MLYIDRKRTDEENPEEEYIDRMNYGIKDGSNFRVQKDGKSGSMIIFENISVNLFQDHPKFHA